MEVLASNQGTGHNVSTLGFPHASTSLPQARRRSSRYSTDASKGQQSQRCKMRGVNQFCVVKCRSLQGVLILTSCIVAYSVGRSACTRAPVTSQHVNLLGTSDKAAVAAWNNWRSSLFLRAMTLLRDTDGKALKQTQPEGHARFSLFDPFVSCPDNQKVARYGGSGDGGKLLCPSLLQQTNCVVYSLGSNNNFDFEQDILGRTSCKVATFDCTSQSRTLGPRHTFVSKCLGSEERMASDPSKWVTLQQAMNELGHSSITLLKIDIEAFEYDVLSTWSGDQPLPAQISIEIHYDGIYVGSPFYNTDVLTNLLWPKHQLSLAELALFVNHLVNMGYAIASREDNPSCPHCSELTLLRIASP